MQLKDFINYRVEMIQPTDTLQEAAEKMRYLDVGSMPVCEGQHLIGVITDRDITIRATAKGQDPTKTEVREAMTADVVSCLKTQQAEEAAKMMQEHQIRRIFVVNENEELVGVTSLGELATVTGDRALSAKRWNAYRYRQNPIQRRPKSMARRTAVKATSLAASKSAVKTITRRYLLWTR